MDFFLVKVITQVDSKLEDRSIKANYFIIRRPFTVAPYCLIMVELNSIDSSHEFI